MPDSAATANGRPKSASSTSTRDACHLDPSHETHVPPPTLSASLPPNPSPSRSLQLTATSTHHLLLTMATNAMHRLVSATLKLNASLLPSLQTLAKSWAYPAAQNAVVFMHLFTPFACFFAVSTLLALLAQALVHVVPHLSVLSLKLVARWPFPGLVTAQVWHAVASSSDVDGAVESAVTRNHIGGEDGATASTFLWFHWFVVVFWVVYLAWVAVDFNTPFTGGTERMRWFRSWPGWAKYWRTYFPITLVRTCPLPMNRNYLFGLHPHGLYCLGAYANFVIEHEELAHAAPPPPYDAHAGPAASTRGFRALFPGLETRTGTLKINFLLPLWRELNLVWKMVSVDYNSCKTWLVHGMGKRLVAPDAAQVATSTTRHRAGTTAKTNKEAATRPRHDSGVAEEEAQSVAAAPSASSSSCGGSDLRQRRVTYVDEEVPITGLDPYACQTSCASPSMLPLKLFKDDTIVADPSGTADYSSSSSSINDLPPPSPTHGAGRALLICIGGAEESLLSRPNRIDLVLLKRKGFIRLALDTGSSVVPVLSFGETDIYQQYQPAPGSLLHHFQRGLKWSMGWTLPMMYGRVGMWLPFRRPITTVVGEPVHLPHVPNPSREVVDMWHEVYVQRLREVWEANRELYAGKETVLELVA